MQVNCWQAENRKLGAWRLLIFQPSSFSFLFFPSLRRISLDIRMFAGVGLWGVGWGMSYSPLSASTLRQINEELSRLASRRDRSDVPSRPARPRLRHAGWSFSDTPGPAPRPLSSSSFDQRLDDYESRFHDQESVLREQQADIADDSLDYARADQEGWFYSDRDPSDGFHIVTDDDDNYDYTDSHEDLWDPWNSQSFNYLGRR